MHVFSSMGFHNKISVFSVNEDPRSSTLFTCDTYYDHVTNSGQIGRHAWLSVTGHALPRHGSFLITILIREMTHLWNKLVYTASIIRIVNNCYRHTLYHKTSKTVWYDILLHLIKYWVYIAEKVGQKIKLHTN